MMRLAWLPWLTLACAGALPPLTPPAALGPRLRFLAGRPRPFAFEPDEAVRVALSHAIVGQDAAVDAIVSAVRDWDDAAHTATPHPLTLFFTGSTGVGKTESARAVARALLGFKGHDHRCLVALMGSNVRSGDDVQSAIAQALYECGGNAVVLLDEAQKAPCSALASLSPMLQRGILARFAHPDVPRGLDASHAVFIIVSDVGDALLRQLGGAGRELTPRLLARKMREALAAEFSRCLVGVDAFAPNVVIYHPLRGAAVSTLISHAAARLASPSLADAVVVSDTAARLLARFSVTYEAEDAVLDDACIEDLTSAKVRVADDSRALCGSSRSSSGGGGGSRSEARVGVDGSQQPPRASSGENVEGGIAACACGVLVSVPPTCVVRLGGRAVADHLDGPVQELGALLRTALRNYPTPKRAREAAVAAERERWRHLESTSWLPPILSTTYPLRITARVHVACPDGGAVESTHDAFEAGAAVLTIHRCESGAGAGTQGVETCTLVHQGAM